MGNFVYGVAQMPPGKSYMAAETECSWSEYMRLWSQITGVPGSYKQVTPDEMIEETADKPFGTELSVMFKYSSAPGYDGGDTTLLKAADIRKVSNLNSKMMQGEYIECSWLIDFSMWLSRRVLIVP